AHQKLLYHQLFAQSSGALLDVGLRQLGIELGLLGVLHTWSRQLIFHPHVHYVVPGGGLTPEALRWVRIKEDYFLPTRVLALRFKHRLRQHLEHARQDLLKQVPAKVWRQAWVVDSQPVGSGEAALKYLSAYVCRTALGAQRIVRDEHGQITFTYRESESGQTRLNTVSAPEFLRRFLQHVLPRGFQRVRYFGWLSPAAVKRWTRIQTLLDWRPPPLPPRALPPPPLCPVCQLPMRCAGRIARGPPVRGP
ncbi:MAG TPA: transposase, partial [Verrucomicrobiae bacterium]|nr:transposase [Verrucomicrobiae bacterium]